ncbi:MAG: flagellar basal-body rod protein FlgF [Arenimonas sp.]
MFQALFNSLSGLFSFSRSLDTVSNNVANMNTPGFRGSDTFFENVNGGRGTRVAGEGLRTTAGDIRQTGTPTDVAIDGNGFFILRDDSGNLYYTRAGQFRFNEEGLLTDSVTGYQVMATDSVGNLSSIDLDTYRTLPPQATTSVRIAGNIAPGTPSFTLGNFQVYDASGTMHTLTTTLTDNNAVTPGSYLVTVKDETGAVVSTAGTEIRFDINGTPLTGFNTAALNLTYLGVSQTVTLNFGTAGAFDGATRLSGVATNLGGQVVDGHPMLGITNLSFDSEGTLQFVYSSSEHREGPQLALASFPNESALELVGGRLIAGSSVQQRQIGRPGEGIFGRIAGGNLELANVDLTQEFADMIIIQRGYQASSRVMTVSNEMIEQLYNSTRG